MLSGMYEAQIRRRGVCAEGKQGAECGYCGVGWEVERDCWERSLALGMGCVEGVQRRDALLWPETPLTKICIVSSSEALELRLEMLSLRRMAAALCVGDV